MTKSDPPYGITGFGGYVPRLRMERASIAAAHQWMAPSLKSLGKGQRAFCSWDEDSMTMAVEAARDVLGQRPRQQIDSLVLASTRMPFADLQNSSVVAGALALRADASTMDIGHSQRSAVAGLLAAFQRGAGNALFIASDHPAAKPASTQELTFGAGAAAFTLGSSTGVIATLAGSASRHNVFVDHFRSTGEKYDYFWEERWIREEGYLKTVPEAISAALQDAGATAEEVDHFILASPLKDMASAVAKKAGIPAAALADHLDATVGYAGSAHACLMLALVLEHAAPGQLIVLAGFGQGCDVLVLRATEALRDFKPRRGVGAAVRDAQPHGAYLRMLSYDGGIELDWGMRGEKNVKTALTEQYRSAPQIGAFTAGRCQACGTVQFPQLPYCVNPACHAPENQFEAVALFDVPAKVLTYTADWLSYHPSPPLYVGFAQFDNGARLLMEMADVDPAHLDVGTPLRAVFRIKDLDKVRGYSRYFWKMTPASA